jgi:hypothetical protein
MQNESLGGTQPRLTPPRQTASAVLMIRPAAFDYNPETAVTNRLQRPAVDPAAPARALAEFDALVGALESEAIAVCLVADTAVPVKPDALFPNNWVSLHVDGTVVLYPMQAANRRRERRPEVLDAVAAELGFEITRIVDLTTHEADGRYLEGTGSLVLDHVNRVAYACVSARTHPLVVQHWSRELGYEAVLFKAVDRSGAALYHTNVMMCLGTDFAVVATEAIVPDDRARVRERLAADGRELIEIGQEEIERFAGNMLELASWDEALGDCRVLVMSEAARRALRGDSYSRLTAVTDSILSVPVPTIEMLGGGSVRCMLAEVFLRT